jgi:AraC family transcriptional regulator
MSRVRTSAEPRAVDLTLEFADPSAKAELHRARRWHGFAAEHVRIDGDEAFSYRWSGDAHYLAIHDIRLIDGEAAVDGLAPDRTRDLRAAMTFLPRGCAIGGWSKPMRRANSFTALTFDPACLGEALTHRYAEAALRPNLYFRDPALRSTLLKLQTLLLEPAVDDLHVESLCLLAAVEMLKISADPDPGKLSRRQMTEVVDFVAANLARPISLEDMAAVAGLSRFHFARAFKRTLGQTPYQFVLARRSEAAAQALAAGDAPIEAVARSVGFGSGAQLGRAFRQTMGTSPQAYRRSRA